MCWNQYVSMNTFSIGIFCLLLIYYNNEYSNYKTKMFENKYAYLFVLSVISMQLVEFFLWRNIDNIAINKIVSILGITLLALQPFTALLLIKDIPLRNKLLVAYSIPTAIYLAYSILFTNIHTVVSKKGHLAWKWFNHGTSVHVFIRLFYLFFMFFPLLYNKYYSSLMMLFAYLVFIYMYHKDGTSGSIWCIFANLLTMYFLFKILIFYPVIEMTSR